MTETTSTAKPESKAQAAAKQPQATDVTDPAEDSGLPENVPGNEIKNVHGEPPPTPDINEAGEAELARRAEMADQPYPKDEAAPASDVS